MSTTTRELASTLSKLRVQLLESRQDLLEIRNLQNSLAETLECVWQQPDIQRLPSVPSAWKEFSSLVASARIPSLSAQASEALSKTADDHHGWLASGSRYSSWLGRGVAELCKQQVQVDSQPDGYRPIAQLCGRAFTIGYLDAVVDTVISSLVLDYDHERCLASLLSLMARYEQRKFLLATIAMVSRRFLPSHKPNASSPQETHELVVGGCAALLNLVISSAPTELCETVGEWLGKGPAVDTGLLRAAIAVIPQDEQVKALEKAWQSFGDKLYIKHTPVLQQENLLRLLVLLAAASHVDEPAHLMLLSRSSLHTQGISNRLGAVSEQVRVLGTLWGTLVSELVDTPQLRMTFEFDEDDKRRLQELRALLGSSFKTGSTDSLRTLLKSPSKEDPTLVSRLKPKTATEPAEPTEPATEIAMIEEINDSEDEDEDADLPVYAKPDSDCGDSDPEDVSVSRSAKTTAPVYIRDLLSMLEKTDDPDVHELALRTAPGLIKRKAAYGSELRDQALNLASAYANLQDNLGLEDWQELRVQGLTALIAACPHEAGPWVAGQIFSGDYSISTRNTLLICMGLAGQSLSGTDGSSSAEEQFPSKTLPQRLHQMYMAETEQSALARRFEPMLHTTNAGNKPKSRLANLIPATLFFPLIAGTYGHLKMRSAALSKSTLPVLLQTLGLLLAHTGVSSTKRPAMAVELWDLTLSLRARAAVGPSLEAVMFAMLGALDAINDRRRIALEKGRELLETQSWVAEVLAQLEQHGVLSDEERRVQSLAAGVGVVCKEIVDQYNRLLLGDMADFQN